MASCSACLTPAWFATQGEDAEAGEEVEVAPALGVEEVAALAADVEPVEADASSGPGPSAGSRTCAWRRKFSSWCSLSTADKSNGMDVPRESERS